MHVRRALLLFAIVLGLAAVAASLSRPGDEERASAPEQATTSTPEADTAPRAEPREETTEVADGASTVELNAAEDEAGRIDAGHSTTLEVAVVEPGQVTIPDLGLTAVADPLTPARFDLLVSSPGRYPIEFTPTEGNETRGAGTLVVRPQSG